MYDNGRERFIKEVVASTIGKCGACDHTYDSSSVSVLGHQDELWFLSVVCESCKSRGLVAALIKEQIQTPSISDLSDAEWSKLADMPKVDADDVLAMHHFLAGFDGNFKGLFGHNSQGDPG